MPDKTIARFKEDSLSTIGELVEYPPELKGGRNLIKNSDFRYGQDDWSFSGSNVELTDNGAVLLKSVEGQADYIQPTTEIPEGDYIVQIWYEHRRGDTPYLYTTNGTDMSIGTTQNLFEKTKEGEEVKEKVTSRKLKVKSKSRFYAIRLASGAPVGSLEGEIKIKKIKIEKSSEPTPWTPAPEDLGLEYPDWVQSFGTSFSENGINTQNIIEYSDELEGGRNLFELDKEFNNYSPYNSKWEINKEEKSIKSCNNDGKPDWFTLKQSNSKANSLKGIYTFSATIEVNGEYPKENIFPKGISTKVNDYSMDYDPKTGFFVYTGDYDGYSWSPIHTSKIRAEVGDEIKFVNLKLEKGDKATPWTPAPEDLGLEYPNHIQHFGTSIKANAIITQSFKEGGLS